MKVLHFGAGNIGRGFIGKVLTDAKAEVIFADVNQALVDQLNAQRHYTVQIVGEQTQQVRVNAVSALHSMSREALAQIAEVDLITTALGPNILAKIASTLAAGLIARCQGKVQRPLNIIACENMLRGSTQLKLLVLKALPAEYHAWVAQQVGFVDAVVDRIVPPSSTAETDLLTVTVESFSEWIIDRGQWKGELPAISGLESTNDLMAFVERKLFTLNTGHAITAYLGQLAGYNTIGQAIMDPQIALDVRKAMQQSGAVLIKRYGFDPQQHFRYIDTILGRFKNPYLKDSVTRVGRQPMRKLSADERLVKPLLGTLEYQLPHCALLKGVAAALHYRNSDDPEAVALQRTIDNEGPMATFSIISGIAITDTRIIPQLTDLYTGLSQRDGSRQLAADPL